MSLVTLQNRASNLSEENVWMVLLVFVGESESGRAVSNFVVVWQRPRTISRVISERVSAASVGIFGGCSFFSGYRRIEPCTVRIEKYLLTPCVNV
jgi:hypothetical protein